MKTKIGINGFGRIGRLAFRIAQYNDDVEIVAINDLLDLDHLAYLLKYDSVHGKYAGTVEIINEKLIVDGKKFYFSLSLPLIDYNNDKNIKGKNTQYETELDYSSLLTEKISGLYIYKLI